MDGGPPESLPEAIRGRGFGLIGLVDGVGDLISSVTVDLVWTLSAPAWGFGFAAALSGMGTLVLLPGARR